MTKSTPRLTSKDTNPKDAVGTGKVPFSVIPAPVLAELGLAMLEGARKYGRHNYRVAGVRASVYLDAGCRHALARWWEGEDLDPDSGLSHITKAIACLVVLRDAMISGNWVDDRPPRSIGPEFWDALNAKAREIITRYPDAKDPYTQQEIDPCQASSTGSLKASKTSLRSSRQKPSRRNFRRSRSSRSRSRIKT